MTTKNNLYSDNLSGHAWDGSAFVVSESVVVPADTDYLVIRVSGATEPLVSATLKGTSDQVFSEAVFLDDSDSAAVGIYYLAAPEAGTFDIDINTGTGARAYYAVIDAISDASAISLPQSATGYSTGSTLTLTTEVDDLVLDIFNGGATATSGADQTDDMVLDGRTTASSLTADAVSEDMSWTMASQRWVHAAISFTHEESNTPATVTTSATNEEGSTITFTHSGLGGPVVSATLTDSGGNILNLTNVVDNLDGTGTADIPAFNTAGQQACLFGEVTLTIASATTERYLQFDGIDDSAAFASSISLGVDEYLELDFLYEDTGSEYQNLFELYSNGGQDFFLIRDSNRIQLRLNPTVYDGTFVPVDGERYVIRLERTATQYEIFVNNVSDFVVTSAQALGPIYGFSDSDADRLGGKVYGATRGVIGGALINNWSTADSSGGTFTDIVGGNNATLVGYPLDESMWVDEVIS